MIGNNELIKECSKPTIVTVKFEVYIKLQDLERADYRFLCFVITAVLLLYKLIELAGEDPLCCHLPLFLCCLAACNEKGIFGLMWKGWDQYLATEYYNADLKATLDTCTKIEMGRLSESCDIIRMIPQLWVSLAACNDGY